MFINQLVLNVEKGLYSMFFALTAISFKSAENPNLDADKGVDIERYQQNENR